jgi:hypothetical protein
LTALAILIAAGIFGCVSAPQEKPDYSGLVWPPPPSKPRVKFVRALRHNLDVEKGDKLARMFGADVVRMALSFPTAVASDGEGRIYVSHRFGMVVFDLEEGRMGTFAEQLVDPRGIAILSDGRIFIVDSAMRKVAVFSKENKQLMEISVSKLKNPQGIALDMERSRIYVTDAKGYEVHAFGFDGKHLFEFEKATGAPLGVVTDRKGNVYVTDQVLGRVAVYNTEGKFQYDIGSLGDSFGNFVRPKGIAFDSDDNLYVTDAAFSNFQIFNTDGQLLAFVGSGGQAYGYLYMPSMMSIDKHDRIYVAERGNHRISVFQYLSKRYYEEHPEEVEPEEAAPGEAAPEETAPEEAAPEEAAPEETAPEEGGSSTIPVRVGLISYFDESYRPPYVISHYDYSFHGIFNLFDCFLPGC